MIREAGGEPDPRGIVPDDRAALERVLRDAREACDMVVVSAGSSVGARDETAAAVAALGEPGIWCHGLSIKPGKPTLLAEAGGVPVIGLPGNPRSALVVFRLVGVPLVRLLGGVTEPPPDPVVRARLARDLPSAAGRLDVVQVRLRDGRRRAAVRQVRAALDAGGGRRLRRDPRARHRPGGRDRGGRRAAAMTFISDVPAAEALAAWREACGAAGCPARTGVEDVAVADAVGRVTAEPVWAARSSPAYDAAAMDGIAVRAADTAGASETTPVLLERFAVVDTGDELPDGFDAVVMREHVHWVGGRPELQAAATPYQHVRTIGEDVSATELLLPEGQRLGPVEVAAAAAAGLVSLRVRAAPWWPAADRHRHPHRRRGA